MDSGMFTLFSNLAGSGTPYISIMHVRDALVISLSPPRFDVNGKNWRNFIRPFFPDDFFIEHPVQELEVQMFSVENGQYQAVIEKPDGIPGSAKAVRRAGPSRNNILNLLFTGIQTGSLSGIEHLHLLTGCTVQYNGKSYSHKKAAENGWRWKFDTGDFTGTALITELVDKVTFAHNGKFFTNNEMPRIPIIIYVEYVRKGELNEGNLMKAYRAISRSLRINHYSPRSKVVALQSENEGRSCGDILNELPDNGVSLQEAMKQLRNDGMRRVIKSTERNPVVQANLISFLFGMGLKCKPAFHYYDDQWSVVYSPAKLFDEPYVLEGFGEFAVACLPHSLPIVADLDAPLGAVNALPVVEGMEGKFRDYGFRLCDKITVGHHELPWLVTLGDGAFEYDGETHDFTGPSIFVSRKGNSIGKLVSELAKTNFASIVAYVLEILYFEQLIRSSPYVGVDFDSDPVRLDAYQVIVNWLLEYVPLENDDEAILEGFREMLNSLSTVEISRISKLIGETKNAEVGIGLTKMHSDLLDKRKALLEGVENS